ncbi:MAG TPA: hypothetical protein VMR17_01550 [Xanthobacteraceae bacterium]|nr:hypothetical protein [Xanthobacteraceae bacterium]
MHKIFARQTLRRRFVALAAAYAIAIASLVASFGAARAAAETAAIRGGVICHTIVGGQSSPATDETTGKICVDNCCVGCLMLLAALPPPPLKVFGAPQSVAQLLIPPAAVVLAAGPHGKSHRSRAPPLSA